MVAPTLAERVPGILFRDEPPAAPSLPRLDVAAFVGYAARGPVDQPIAVEDVAEYERRFGSETVLVDEDGRWLRPQLRRAVAAFFENGGRRCWVVRVASPGARRARIRVRGLYRTDGARIHVRAASAGAWGNGLRLRTHLAAAELSDEGVGRAADGVVRFPASGDWAPGDLLRLTDRRGRLWLFAIERVEAERTAAGARPSRLAYGAVVDVGPETPGGWDGSVRRVERLTFDLEAQIPGEQRERWQELGFEPAHPRYWLRVLQRESALLGAPEPDDARTTAAQQYPSTMPDRMPGRGKRSPWTVPGREDLGRDRLEGLSAALFAPPELDRLTPALATELSARANEERERLARGGYVRDPVQLRGLAALIPVSEVALVAVPDAVLLRGSLPPRDDARLARPPRPPRPDPPAGVFLPCEPPDHAEPRPEPALARLVVPTREANEGLEPEDALAVQRAALRLCQARGDMVAVLAVPPGQEPAAWRRQLEDPELDPSYAVLYHPWTRVKEPGEDRLRAIPPDGAAAGSIARRERERGVWVAPANLPLTGVLGLQEHADTAAWADLLDAGVNLVRRLPDDFRFMSARTLSEDRELSQLNVRRLLILLKKALLLWGRDYAFEGNTPALRARLRGRIEQELERLFRAGAFAGATPAEAYRVVLDESVNPPASVDVGRLVVLVKVSPSWPLELIEIRLVRTGEGVLQVAEA